MKDTFVIFWIIIFSISITANIIGGFELHKAKNQFSGTVQECWDNGGDSFYADKNYGVSCTQSSVKIKLKGE